MDPSARGFLLELLSTPGVSGYEQTVQGVVRQYAQDFVDELDTDLHGNLILGSRVDSGTRVMLAGHCDQIGLIVSHIDDQGFLFVQTVGGWDPQQLVGQAMTVWTDHGPLPGVIARKPIHLLEEPERKKVVKTEEMWVDIGARSAEEAESRVRIGDSVTLKLDHHLLLNNLVASPGMDNRTGLWVVVEAHRRAQAAGLSCALFTASTVQEEIGLRGARTAAYAINPHVGIAVDVTHATDCPSLDPKQNGKIKLGGGPVISRGPNINPRICERLFRTGRDHGIDTQASALGRAAPNDSNALQINRQGVATGLVGVPNRYMHSAVEVCSLDDLDQSAELLARFVTGIEGQDLQAFKP